MINYSNPYPLRNLSSYLLVVFFLLISFSGKAENKDPYLVKTKDFHVNSFAFKQICFGITTVIYNPYKVKVTIDEILIDVFIKNKKLTTITEASELVKIRKESAFDLPLKADVKTGPTVTTIFREGTKLLFAGKKVTVNFKGYIKLKALGFIPVKVKVDETESFGLKDLRKPPKATPK